MDVDEVFRFSTFLSSHLKFSDVETVGFVPHIQWVSKTLSAFAMIDVEQTRSSGYYSDICLEKEQQVVDDFPLCKHLSM